MKRVVVRSALLASLVGLGYVGIVQIQKGFGPQSAGAPAAPAAEPKVAGVTPIPLSPADDSEAAPAADPFGRAAAAASARGADAPANADNTPRDYAPPRDSAAQRDNAAPRDYAAQPAAAAGSPADDQAAASDRPHYSSLRGGANRRPDPFGAAQPETADQVRSPQQAAPYTPDTSDAVVGGQPPAGDEPRRLAPASEDGAAAMPIQPAAAERHGRPPVSDGMARLTSAEGNEAPSENLFAGPAAGAADDAQSGAQSPGGQAAAQQVDGVGRPGSQQLEGSQTPALAIEKTAPAEIQVGKPATFVIKVRNAGTVIAHGVEIHDDIPQGTQLVSTKPAAAQTVPGQLVWALGTMKPGQEVTVQVQLMPVAEGEIGSMATVHFRAEASVRTRSTRPAIALQVSLPPKVMIGENLTMKIRVSNPGTGAASGVVLTENVPLELKHEAGNELELEIGTLKPGESRDLDLTLTAAQAGHVVNLLSARGDANLRAEDRSELDVLAPALKLSLTGPKRRYLERNATFNVAVSNPGTAAAREIELAAVLPKGMKFVEANNLGQFDAATSTVYWSLEELPAHESGTVTFTALPLEPGDLKMQVRGKAKQGLSDACEETVVVDGLAAIMFELVDVQDPVEVNGQATYEIRLVNQGSKGAANVRIVALLPPEMRPLSADGPVRYHIDGQRVLFDPLNQLAPKADTTYTIKAQALQAGDSRIRVQLLSDEIRTPITKEESTRVFADE